MPEAGPVATEVERLRHSTQSELERPQWDAVLALVGFVAAAQLAGLVGLPVTDRAIDSWYDGLDRPAFNPPNWVFGPVWTVLYVLIGVAAWRVWRHRRSEARTDALTW